MPSHMLKATKAGKLNPPKWMQSNVHYEVIMGSNAYGISGDNSDLDIYGWAIPPKEMIFPHLAGHIPGFGPSPETFEQFQIHHVQVNDTEYDFTIYSIVKYFQLVLENNPNMIDSLFVPNNCVTHMSALGQIPRDARKMFLHKGSYAKFKGYAYSQMHKINTKANSENPKRQKSINDFGYDVKFATHTVRLLDECEQILVTKDIDLQRNNDQLKAIRRGEWTKEQVFSYVEMKEKVLEELFAKSTLRQEPEFDQIKKMLMSILETHYGSISEMVRIENNDSILKDLQALVEKYGN